MVFDFAHLGQIIIPLLSLQIKSFSVIWAALFSVIRCCSIPYYLLPMQGFLFHIKNLWRYVF